MSEETKQPEQPTEMVQYKEPPVATEEGLLARWEDQRSQAVTSLDMESDDGKSTYLRCLQKATYGGQDAINTVLRIRDWLLHPVTLVDPGSGEIRSALRLVFVLANGDTVGTTGPAVLSTWRHAIQGPMYGRGPYEPPIEVVLDKVQGRGPFPYLYIKSLTRTRDAGKAKHKS